MGDFSKTNRRTALQDHCRPCGRRGLPDAGNRAGRSWNFLASSRVLRDTDREGHPASRWTPSAVPTPSFRSIPNKLQRVAEYYQRLTAMAAGPSPTSVYNLVLGNNRSQVRDLREYLIYTGDLPREAGISNMFDSQVDAAVRGFQARHGLQINGKVDEITYWTMTVPTAERLRQIELNLERVRALEGKLTDRYVNVNIPAATIEAVEGRSTSVTRRSGRIDRQTPILRSRITRSISPYRTVPVDHPARYHRADERGPRISYHL